MSDIRKYIKIVESAYVLEQDINTVIDQIFMESTEQLDEGIIGDVKAKVGKWLDKVGEKGNEVLPALKAKYDQAFKSLQSSDPDKAKQVEAEMTKQAGSDWKKNANKFVAALAVVSSLAAVAPAQGQEYYNRYGQRDPAGALKMQQQNPAMQRDWQAAEYQRRNMPPGHFSRGPDRRQMGPTIYPPGHPYYQGGGNYYDQRQQGVRGGDVAVGVVIGAALGAIMMRR